MVSRFLFFVSASQLESSRNRQEYEPRHRVVWRLCACGDKRFVEIDSCISIKTASVDIRNGEGLLGDKTPWRKMLIVRVSPLSAAFRFVTRVTPEVMHKLTAGERVWIKLLFTRVAHKPE